MIKFDVSTTEGADYYKDWYTPFTEWKPQSVKWRQLPEYYSFDLEKLRADLTRVRGDYDFKPFVVSKKGKIRTTYQGISLTSRKESEDPEYDGLKLFGYQDGKEVELDINDTFAKFGNDQTTELNEKIFSEPTQAYSGYFAEVVNKFHSIKTKCRILNLKPRGVISPHVDFPYYRQIRVHAALYTNDDTWFEVEGERFQIPADGNFYWFDVGRDHAVSNNGTTDRITLSVNLSVYDHFSSSDDLMTLMDNCKI
jgi:hypothetical protein